MGWGGGWGGGVIVGVVAAGVWRWRGRGVKGGRGGGTGLLFEDF